MTEIAPSTEQAAFAWTFGQAVFDEGRWELLVTGQAQALERKPLEVLAYLLRHAGEVVTKDELLDAVWTGRVVVEGALTNAIGKLRKSLGDEEQSLIVTVPRVGYRLMGKVERRATKRVLPQSRLNVGDVVPRRPNWKLETRLDAAIETEVWLARHAKTGEARVFKFSLDGARLGGLKREATVSRLLHAGLGEREDIVRVIDWDFEDAPYFLECEYGGQDLLAWADTKGGLANVTVEQRVDWLRRVAETVDAAHGLGVLHKDLKPANLLLAERDGAWQPRVADFGSSQLTSDAHLDQFGITNLGFTQNASTSSDSGTPYYMAPEVVAGGVATARSDIFALGVLLYQLVVGDLRRPLYPGWEKEIADPVLREDIAAAAHGDPEARLGSARELAQRLSTLDERRQQRAERETSEAKQSALQQQLDRTRARRPWMLTAAAVLLGGLAISLVLYAQSRRSELRTQEQLAVSRSLLDFVTKDLLAQASPQRAGKAGLSVEEAIDRSVASIKDRFAGKPEVEGSIRHAIGLAYSAVSEPEKAVEQFGLAADLWTQASGPQDARVFDARLARARDLGATGHFDQSAAELARVETAIAANPDIPRDIVAEFHNAQAIDADMQNKADVAMSSIERAIEIAITIEDFDPKRLLRYRRNLAAFYTQAGRYTEALPVHEAIIAALEQEQGSKGSETLMAMLSYSQLLFATGRTDDGFASTERLLRDMPEVFGASDPIVGSAHGLAAEGYLATNQPDEAAAAYQRAYDIYRVGLGEASPYTLQMMQGQGQALRYAKKLTEAVDVLRRASEAAHQHLPPDSPMIGGFDWDYGYALLDAGDVESAHALLSTVDTDLVHKAIDSIDWPGRIALLKGRVALGQGDRTAATQELELAEQRLAKAANDDSFLQDTRKYLAQARAPD